MADEAQYESHKRKYEEDTSPPRVRRPTGFSDGPSPAPAPYGNVPPPLEDFQLAKQKIQELASLAFNAEAKRSKFDNGGYSSNVNVLPDQKPPASNIQVGSTGHSYSGSKKIDIPNGRVGVIIGKAGDTIKNLQIQSGARIQVTRDADHDPNFPTRAVELMGNQDQIAKAEQLINEVLAEAEAGGPGSVSRRMPGASGESISLKVPSNKVGLVIGKGGETIKNIQSTSGARVQVIPLHLPPGDATMERTVQIDGTTEQIEIAKQMVNEVIENRVRNQAMTGAYPQQNYQARPPTSWAPQPPQMQQPGGYGYMQQQPGTYPGAQSQYNVQTYPGYPPQNWDQSSAPQNQQPPQGTGYDYYGQQQPPTQQQQQQPPNAPQSGNTGYNYNQPPSTGGYNQQGYSQEGYGAGYHGYGQQPANPQSGYDQRQGYSSTPSYGNATTTPTQDGHPPAYGTQGETGQAPSSGQPQQGYMGGQPSPNPAYPTHGTTQPGYGVPPTSQSSYGTPSVAQGYGPPQGQKTPPNPSAYGQPQQSPSQAGAYAQHAPGQPGYPPSQPTSQVGVAATYGGGTAQPGAYPPAYGAPPATTPAYGQQPYYGGAYSQPAGYSADDNGVATAPAPAYQPAAQPNVTAKASPQS
ncbi:hypothetical protein BVRB_2g033340 [Beta vulgaris subsp. vulgaris]|uniref:K Homology domain-containing protein n=1 Tax=Beta vulgaris subsp. vulgaris TaxID=3555 RepID=A0A0J8D1G5_BETVV|nr:hypothetical protein BVRB_2g033340 [Beta vulgaris subsp. vulgaris]